MTNMTNIMLVLTLLTVVRLCTSSYIIYSTVEGYFLQDELSTNATTFDYKLTNFGLITQNYNTAVATDQYHFESSNLTQWQKFAFEVTKLNDNSPSNTVYKVLFLGRHGEGDHNTAESYYGTPAWNCYWSLLIGNGTRIFEDAHLTETGIQQALDNNAFWRHELTVEKMPAPESYYTSPLYRCLQTANYTFSGLDLPEKHPFIPTIKEKFREGISEHTCDHRSNKTFIQSRFPGYVVEPGFTEYDELWTGKYSETESGQDSRSKSALDDVFNHDSSTWISITSHSGEIASLLRVLGHRPFTLSTGAIIPVLVKAESVEDMASSTIPEPASTPSRYCTAPPAASISGKGCICWSDVIASSVTQVTQTSRSHSQSE